MQSILSWLRTTSHTHPYVIAGLFCIILGAGISGVLWSTHTEYTTLFAHLAPEEAAKIIGKMDKEHVPYHVNHAGNTILVPQDRLAKIRLQVLGDTLDNTGRIGFEQFDHEDFGVTEFSQKIHYQRALQGELERTINHLAPVQ